MSPLTICVCISLIICTIPVKRIIALPNVLGTRLPQPTMIPIIFSTGVHKKEENCSTKNYQRVVGCVMELLPLLDFGIPSNRYETETACRSFKTAIKCLSDWVKMCMNQTSANDFFAYISPAVETYDHICKDARSRAQFYRHGECSKKISLGFDSCVDRLGEMTAGLDSTNHSRQICCHNKNFVKCVSNTAWAHNCTKKSVESLTETAERTVELRPNQVWRSTNGTKTNCLLVTFEECNLLLKNNWEIYGAAVLLSNSYPPLLPLLSQELIVLGLIILFRIISIMIAC